MLPISIDSFGLVVALPSISSRFSATTSELAWVLNMAILFFGAGAMVLGRLSDIVGRTAVVCLIGVAAAPATRGANTPTPIENRRRRASDRVVASAPGLSYRGSPPVAAAVDPESW